MHVNLGYLWDGLILTSYRPMVLSFPLLFGKPIGPKPNYSLMLSIYISKSSPVIHKGLV